MNIVQVSSGDLRIPVDKGGGIEAYILHLSKSLVKAGHTVVILDRKYSRHDPDSEDIEGVKILRLQTKRSPRLTFTLTFALNQMLFAYGVKKYLAKADVDVVQTHQSIMGLFLAMTAADLRDKLFYLSQTSRRGKESVNFLDRIALALEDQLAKRASKVMVLNDSVRQKLILAARLKPGKVTLLPVSIDISRFNTNGDLGDIRQRYGLDKSVAVLFVGRIHPDKGVEYLVKAANIVVNESGCRTAKFLLVGPTEQFNWTAHVRSTYLDKISGLIDEYGLKENMTLTGAIPFEDLKRLYAACDIFVLPSLTEAAPTASLEAMASGKPVVGTKVGGIPAQIQEGKSGFLIDPANERQLAEKISYLIDNPAEAKKMGTYGRKVAEEEFSPDKIATRLLQVYQGETA